MEKILCETDGASVGDLTVVETPHMTIVWDGLEEVKQLSTGLGEVLSSSCIPSVSTVGIKFSLMTDEMLTCTTRW